MQNLKISIVVSVYNEEKVLKEFKKEITRVLSNIKYNYELIYVNDGSKDNSENILKEFAKENKKVRVISFARNFGHESAMIAGIDNASGDLIICMDADLQNPPETIPEIIKAYENGSDIILMARTENKDAGLLKNITSNLFYKVFNILSGVNFERNVSDFFAISKRTAEILRKEYRENKRYLRGYVQNIGFDKTVLKYQAKKRVAGKSNYNIKSLINISIIAITNFSTTPLRFSVGISSGTGVLTLIFLILSILKSVNSAQSSGTFWIMTLISFLFTIQFLILGVIGEYLGNVLSETRKRPIYIIKEIIN